MKKLKKSKTPKAPEYLSCCPDCRRERRDKRERDSVAKIRTRLIAEYEGFENYAVMNVVFTANAQIVGFFLTRKRALEWIKDNCAEFDGSYVVSFGLRDSPELVQLIEYLRAG